MSAVEPHDDELVLERERRDLVYYSQRLQGDALATSTSGNLSARSGGLVAITPSGVDYDELTPAIIGVHRLDGSPLQAPLAPSTELPFHLAIYRSTDALAIVHTHALHATVLSTLVDELPPIHYLLALFGGPPRTAPYAPFGTEELASSIIDAMKDRSAVLLANHGAITIGASLKEAYGHAVYLEWVCALVVKARMLGSPRLLPEGELDLVAERLRGYGPEL